QRRTARTPRSQSPQPAPGGSYGRRVRGDSVRQHLGVGCELDVAAEPVLDVDDLVLAVRPEEAEQHRHPAHAADLALLDDRAVEADEPVGDPVVRALGLLDAVQEDVDRWLGAAGKPHPSPNLDALLLAVDVERGPASLGLIGHLLSARAPRAAPRTGS